MSDERYDGPSDQASDNPTEWWERAAYQTLDALVEAVYLYEIPILVVFKGRKRMIWMLRNSILDMRNTEGENTTSMFKRRVLIYKEITGVDLDDDEGDDDEDAS